MVVERKRPIKIKLFDQGHFTWIYETHTEIIFWQQFRNSFETVLIEKKANYEITTHPTLHKQVQCRLVITSPKFKSEKEIIEFFKSKKTEMAEQQPTTSDDSNGNQVHETKVYSEHTKSKKEECKRRRFQNQSDNKNQYSNNRFVKPK